MRVLGVCVVLAVLASLAGAVPGPGFELEFDAAVSETNRQISAVKILTKRGDWEAATRKLIQVRAEVDRLEELIQMAQAAPASEEVDPRGVAPPRPVRPQPDGRVRSAEEVVAEAKAAQAAAEAATNYDTGVEFSVETTFKPARCDRVSSIAYPMKIHYLGKLVKDERIFASSFHTGSNPVKVIVGAEENIPGWNRALVGMCEGERRTVTIPWSEAYGPEGNAAMRVPPFADVRFMIECVELYERPSRAHRHLLPADDEEDEPRKPTRRTRDFRDLQGR